MINTYLTNITPDSLSGMIFGLEGIKRVLVLLNGPSGCKFYHSALADSQHLRQCEFDPLNYPELWFFGQPRIPCTYLDKRDYVYGSRDKIIEAMNFFNQNIDCDLIAIINAPGAALIGDDLNQIVEDINFEVPVITIETPGYSKRIWQGYSDVCVQLIKEFALAKNEGISSGISSCLSGDKLSCTHDSTSVKKKRVNILGLSIFHKYYQGDLKELKRLLDLCDIELNCVLCCESSLNEIENISNADLNIVIDKKYGLASAKLLETMFGMEYIAVSGLPIGFKYVEELFEDICAKLGCDNSVFLIESEKARGLSYIHLSRINSLTGLPKGVQFAIHGTVSQCLGYARYFIHYFGMVADCISLIQNEENDGQFEDDYIALSNLLSKYDMQDALNKDILDTQAQLVFADGNIIAKLKLRHHSFSGIEINLPTLGYIDIMPKTHFGIKGSLFLCEQVVNGLLF